MIPLFYTTLPYRLTYISLPSPQSIIHYPSFPLFYTILLALHPTLPFLLSILHYTSFSSQSYPILPSLYPTLLFLFSIHRLQYPSFSSPFYTTQEGKIYFSVECMRGEERKDSVFSSYFGSHSIYFQFEER